jgi:hypothetical protein
MMPSLLKYATCALLSTFMLPAIATSALSTQPQITTCPATFHQVVIHNEARQCQRFDTQLPASLIYFVAATPDAMLAYYLTTMPELDIKAKIHDRVLLVSTDESVRIVVSADGKGAQIDILVTAEPSQ